MSMPAVFEGKLTLPVIAAPMFLVSGTELVIEACRAGVVGTFPALNARPLEVFDRWLGDIKNALAETPDAAPHGVNLIVHRSNVRLEEDIAITVEHEVPLVISSVGFPGPVVDAVHSYGGLVFADVIHMHHARKAIQAGVDGVILVAAGAGGHAGTTNPFAMVRQLREFYDGTVILGGAISDGASVAAAQVMGADFAYLGTRFIATKESTGGAGYSQMIVESEANDIVYTDAISGIKGNFMRASLERAGLDPENLPPKPTIDMDKEVDPRREKKAWKDVWSAGQGVGNIHDVPSTAELVATLKREYDAAMTVAVEAAGYRAAVE